MAGKHRASAVTINGCFTTVNSVEPSFDRVNHGAEVISWRKQLILTPSVVISACKNTAVFLYDKHYGSFTRGRSGTLRMGLHNTT
jgi:hypothetical protein